MVAEWVKVPVVWHDSWLGHTQNCTKSYKIHGRV